MHKSQLTLFGLTLFSIASSASAVDGCSNRSGSHVVPLVELFTSEGCSSCPPADRWLSRQLDDVRFNFLAFHVDYWDGIGWPDRFADARYSQRQRIRVRNAGSNAVYTPQVMIGEVVQAPWQTPQGWRKMLEKTQQPAPAALAMRLSHTQKGWEVAVAATNVDAIEEGAQVWLARFVDGQTSTVLGGENSGRTLYHDRVVRQLSGPWPLVRKTSLRRVSVAADNAPWGITAFVQDRHGRTLQSLNLPATGCLKSLKTERSVK